MKHTDGLIVGAGPAGSVCGSLLKQAGVDCIMVDHATFPREKVCGGGMSVKAYISLDTVQSTVDHVILIGDAGGFANKLTGEGLYDAFKTAANAKQAIVEGKPFSVTNREEFRKMEHQVKVFNFFFSPCGWRLIRWGMSHPRMMKWLFDAKMKRETFRKK